MKTQKNVSARSPEISENDRTTAVGLARYAYEYLEAAILVDEREAGRNPGSQISPIPAYFLASHAIELTLKAYLRLNRLTVDQLSDKKYGHNLRACYRKAKEFGLLEIFNEHPNDVAALDMLIGLNEKHGLRYIRTGAKQFPLWSIVEPFAVRLHQAVASKVGFRSFTRTFPEYAPVQLHGL